MYVFPRSVWQNNVLVFVIVSYLFHHVCLWMLDTMIDPLTPTAAEHRPPPPTIPPQPQHKINNKVTVVINHVNFPRTQPFWKPQEDVASPPSMTPPQSKDHYQVLKYVMIAFTPTASPPLTVYSAQGQMPSWVSVLYKHTFRVATTPFEHPCQVLPPSRSPTTLILDSTGSGNFLSLLWAHWWGSLYALQHNVSRSVLRTSNHTIQAKHDVFRQMVDVILQEVIVDRHETDDFDLTLQEGRCYVVPELLVPLPQTNDYAETLKLYHRSLVLRHFNLSGTFMQEVPSVVIYSGGDRGGSNGVSNANLVFEAFQRVLSSSQNQKLHLIDKLESMSFDEQVRFASTVHIFFSMEGAAVYLSLYMPLPSTMYIVTLCQTGGPNALQLFPTQSLRQWRMCDNAHGGQTICIPGPTDEAPQECSVIVDPNFAWLTVGSILEEDVRPIAEKLREYVGPQWLRNMIEVMYIE
eukprot:PhF_6_TR43402/c0_g1_i1/m.66642